LDSKRALAKPSKLTEWAYEIIKNDILSGGIDPGEKLLIADIAVRLNISRTPIREALLKLREEGLVDSFSRVGFFVRDLSAEDLRELFELREITEAYAAEKAASRLTDSDLVELDTIQKASVQAVNEGRLEDFNKCEIALHAFIIKHSENSRLQKLSDGLSDLTSRERRLAIRYPENVRISLSEHGKIVEALARKDGTLARTRMIEHLRNVYSRLLPYCTSPGKTLQEDSDE
jgi:DNA-binding GntR family transcriptional regulator